MGKNAKKKSLKLQEKLAFSVSPETEAYQTVKFIGLAASGRRLSEMPEGTAKSVLSHAISEERAEIERALQEHARRIGNDCRQKGSRRISRDVRDIEPFARLTGTHAVKRAFGSILEGRKK